jgi:hypothetical protein
MKNLILSISTIFLLVFLSGCEVVGGIFKAGVWSGVLLVVVIIAVIIFIVSRMFRGKT